MTNIKKIVYVSLFAALIAAGSVITIPLGPVPISLQTLFVFLAALLLGPKLGTMSVFVYLAAGAVGLPVFSGGTGGIARFLGPTGGYLIGFLLGVWIIGSISSSKKKYEFLWDVIAMIAGTAIIYLIGVIWLKIVLGISFHKAVYVGLLPFLPGDAVKIAAGAYIAKKLRRIIV